MTKLKRVFVIVLMLVMVIAAIAPATLAENETTAVVEDPNALSVTTRSRTNFLQYPMAKTKAYVSGMKRIPSKSALTVVGTMGNSFLKVQYAGFEGFVQVKDLNVKNVKATTTELCYFRIKETSSTKTKYLVPEYNTIPAQSEVKVLSSSSKYMKVVYNNVTGYIRNTDVKLTEFADLTPKLSDYNVSAYETSRAKTNTTVNFRMVPEAATMLVEGCESIKKKKTVIIDGEYGDFYRITYGDYTGFAYKTDISVLYALNYTVEKLETPIASVMTSSCNFRVDPSTDADKVDGCSKISRKREVTVIGYYGDFAQVTYKDYTGFVAKEFVEAAASDGGTTEGGTATAPSAAPEALAKKMNAAAAKNSDVVGYIYVPNTNIDYPIMNNRYNSSKRDFVYNLSYDYIFTMANPGAQGISCIMGHNMRTSRTMFHQLHHVQNFYMGVSSCQKCKKSCKSADPGEKWTILYDGYTYWQPFAMFETTTSESRDTLNYMALNSKADSTAKAQWIQYVTGRSQKNFGISASASDKIIVLITCGDLKGGTTGARLYIALKAVG